MGVMQYRKLYPTTACHRFPSEYAGNRNYTLYLKKSLVTSNLRGNQKAAIFMTVNTITKMKKNSNTNNGR